MTLTVTDGSFTATATLQLTFTADPALPVIISPGYASLTPNEFFTYTINASAACGSSGVTTLSFIGTLPAGLTFNAATDTISGIYTGPLGPELAGGAFLEVSSSLAQTLRALPPSRFSSCQHLLAQ